MSRIVCIDTWIEFHMWSGVLDCLYRNILTKVSQGVVLIKDNLEIFFWNENKFCAFCAREETIQHLFSDCVYAKFF
jgi:hypothetical protein